MVKSVSSDDDDNLVIIKKKSNAHKKSKQEAEDNSDVPDKRSMKKQTSKVGQSKTTHTRGRLQKKTSTKGLDGEYWNGTASNRQMNAITPNYRKLDGGNGTSSDNSPSTLSRSSSSSSSSSDDDESILYENDTFITCRNPSDGFYLCQVLQNVYTNTKQIRIRWCSVVGGEDGDDTQISIKTHFKLSYTDKLDPETILTSIPDVIHHSDGTLSLKKSDIVETKRLLQKSIRNESLSSEDVMDFSADDQNQTKKKSNHVYFRSSSDNSSSSSTSAESSTIVSPNSRKRKMVPIKKRSRKQPPNKRARKAFSTLKTVVPKRKQRRTKATGELPDGDDDVDQPKKKKKTKEKPPKPVKVPKVQLFKVHSNRSLRENATVRIYHQEPFFEDNLPVPFISSFVQSKLAIRAVFLNDTKLLKSLINDIHHVCSIHVPRSLFNELSAVHYAVKNNNLEMIKILLDDVKSPKKNRCPFPTVSMTTQSTGRANIHTFGFRTAQLMASRGAKEGNNALNKDSIEPLSIGDDEEIISYALKNNCSREMYDLLFKTFKDSINSNKIYENIYKIIAAGHRQLAASIIGDIKDNAFYGFNYLHHQVLLYDNEDITINRSASVLKKTQANSLITPIHCAAINPNAKYLKQLLNTMPEYNILDKYERRPIHFAAACEGSDPLEYLLSKHVNFNDVDRGGNSPLHIAAMNGRAINAEVLLRTAKEKAGLMDAEDQIIHEKFGLASINRMNKSRFYPLHLAVLNNHLNCVQILLEYEAPIDVVTSASVKITPLMLACQKGYLNIVKYLISQGAKVEARDRFQRTPLIHACMCGHADIVSYLLHLGANANVFDSSMNTALHYAVAYGWYFCVRALLEVGANLNCVNSWQTTCLAAGFLKGHYGLCDYLLTDHHADINFKTDDGLTLVMLTVGLPLSSSVVEQLEYVVTKHKADCTAIDANGSNAFHYLAANTSDQNTRHTDEDTKKALNENYFNMAKILLDHHCDPNQMNSKSQSPLMIALQTENFILVDYLIGKAHVSITADISHEGKTLLHYFAQKCDRQDLIQLLLSLPMNNEIKKMGQIFDNNGRTPLHYCAWKFDRFCLTYKSSKGTDRLKNRYQSIVQMIEYCLEAAECDPDSEIKSVEELKIPAEDNNEDDDDDDEKEEEEETTEVNNESDDEDKDENDDKVMEELPVENEKTDVKLKETTIFSLLRAVPFIDDTINHPLKTFLQKTKNPNVHHHKTHRTPLLEAIHLRQSQTAQMLIHNSLCDINLSTSNLPNERQQTPLISACRLQLPSVIRCLLEHKRCHISLTDYNTNQAIHYYLQTSNRANDYLDILNIFIKKLKLTTTNSLNIQGNHQRTPLHIAVYHNLGNIDAITSTEKVLIDNGSDLMAKDSLGNIPLHNVFLNKNSGGDDPVELCVVLMKAMKYQEMDTKNNEGNTPLHLAVTKCSTVCVMLLQQHHASLFIENNLSNSIIGTCIASGHLNLFITFLQQSFDIDLGKLHYLPVKKLPEQTTDDESSNTRLFGRSARQRRTHGTANQRNGNEKEDKKLWKWEYDQIKIRKEYDSYSLMYLIIERDWQGALSLILNDIDRFHLNILQIIETAILTNKLNLVLRLLLSYKDDILLRMEMNSSKQTLCHLLANMNEYNDNLLKQILVFLHDYDYNWHTLDIYGSYPLHYACVKQNFLFMDFLRENSPKVLKLSQTDGSDNTANSLLFWSIAHKTTFANKKLQPLITSDKQLNCLCNYNNETSMNPLSFGYVRSMADDIAYPPVQSDHVRTSPLIHAIVHNNFELVKFLLELNADVNYVDENKQTPLMHAVRQNNIDIVKLLLNKNYSLDDDQTPQEQTHFRGKSRARPSPRRRFFLGATTTNSDETSNKTKSTTFQRTSSIDLNTVDSNGRTCIHHLIQPFAHGSYRNNIEILRLLHSCGASLTIADRSGLTPLQSSMKNNYQHLHNELTTLLKSKTSSMRSTIEQFSVHDPNKELLDKPNFYDDAERLIDEYISTHPTSKYNPAYKVDSSSGMSLTGEVLIDTDKNEPYDVRLTKIDVNYAVYGLYNFYHMQIIKHKSKANLYFLFTHWGRIGSAEGQHQLTPYSTLDECRKEFVKIFREKTGNIWKDTDTFTSKPKKYTLVGFNEREMKKHASVPIDFDRLQAEHEQPSSQLQSSVYKNLMRTLISRQAVRRKIHKTQLDVEWMPVSQLKRQTLEKARDLLLKIKEALEKKDQLNADNSHLKTAEHKNELKDILESIYQYTNEYYTLIPLNGYSDEKLPILDDKEGLKEQEKILDDLFQLELSYKILLGAQANSKHISPLDYLYKSINCQFEAMNKDDIDSQSILRYIWTSAPDVMIEQMFKIARPKEDERLRKRNLSNHYLLWHGTSICNLISILSRGLLVGSLVATATGSLFGTGIYTADVFAKSLGYCSGVEQNGSERCFMLLCEVALGSVKEVGARRVQKNDEDEDEEAEEEEEEDDDDVLDFKKYQSRKGTGRNVPDPKHTIVRNDGVQMPLGQLIENKDFIGDYYGLNYNEYIVYDETQVALRYLVQFRR